MQGVPFLRIVDESAECSRTMPLLLYVIVISEEPWRAMYMLLFRR